MRDASIYAIHANPRRHLAPTDRSRFLWQGRQAQGSRDNQEDSLVYDLGFGVVSDGVGGQRNGAEASRAATCVPFPADGDTDAYVREVNRAVIESRGACTLVWARATASYLEIGQCGDSGAAWVTPQGFQWLTPASPSPRSNLLLTCFGSREDPPEVTIHRYLWPAGPGVVLLYSDGLDPLLDLRAERRRFNTWRRQPGEPELPEQHLERGVLAHLPDLHTDPAHAEQAIRRFVDYAVMEAVRVDRADNATLLAGAFRPGGW